MYNFLSLEITSLSITSMVLPSCLIKRGLNPSIKDLNQFLSSLLRAQKLELVLYLFSQITSNSIVIDSKTRSLISHTILKTRRLEEAERFISDAGRFGFLPQNRLWNSLIHKVCVLEGDPDRALKLLQELTRNRGVVPSANTFRTLVSTFISRGKMDSALEVFEIMIDRKNGYQIDNFVCSSIVSGFSKIGRPDLSLRFYERVKKLSGFSPNLITNTAAVDAFGREGRIEEACDLVRKMEEKGIVLDAVLYSSWISGYLREGLLMEGLRKHQLMADRGTVVDVVCYTNIIDGLCKEGIVEKVIGFLDEMEKRNIRPNLITYTAIIGGFCKRNKLDEAFCMFKKMEESGMVVDEYVYSILIDCLCKKGDLDRAFSLLEEMENKGIKGGTVIYNAVINGLCKAGKTRKGDEISESLVADNFTYSTLLHGYMKEKDVQGMMAVKQRFENDAISTDVVMCNVLIKALLMVGMVDDACGLFNKMPEMGLVANSITYYTMIDGHFKLGRTDKALELFNEYRIACSSSSAVCHNCVIKTLCKEGMLDMAVEVFLDIIDKKIFPDSITYRKLIAAHFKEHAGEGVLQFIHRMEISDPEVLSLICNEAVAFLSTKDCCTAALDLYMLVRRRGFAVTSKTSNVLLKCLLRNTSEQVARLLVSDCIKFHGIFEPRMINLLSRYLCKKNVEKALQFSNDMGNQNISVTVLRTAVDALRKDGKFHDAYNFLKESEEKGLAVDLAAYSMVVDELCKEGYVKKALDLCASMKRKGIYPNIVIHNSVLNGLCRQGCLFEAFRLFDSLECNNVLPTVITYATLIGALCREGFLQDANELFESMPIRGIAPNTRVYNLMISGYCNFGLVEDALKLLNDLEENCLLPDAFTEERNCPRLPRFHEPHKRILCKRKDGRS
ncbi:pentatricopeptide repeat-containing protein At5g57250, mitochondrial isoform X2 [Typha latifolia]|uniref:pentatricopeptide repeat-containing protein At5g57250, mitochondrial isoform X2 n=1 Tax=Typha latifolia TaxID=4733 RepID=UPI003C2C82A6